MLAWIISSAVGGSASLTDLTVPLLFLALAFALRALVQGGREELAQRASREIRGDLRYRLFAAIQRAGPIRKPGGAGSLSDHLTNRIDRLDGYYARFLPSLVAAGIVPLVIIVVGFALDWLAAALLLLTAPLIPLFMVLVGLGAHRIARDQQDAMSRLAGHFLDRLQGLPTIRLHNARGWLMDQTQQATDDYRRLSLAVLRVAFLSSAVLEFFSAVAIASVAIYVGLGLLGSIGFGPAGELTLFTGLFVLLLAPEFFQPLRQMAQHYHDRADAMGAVPELQTLGALPPARQQDPTAANRETGAEILVLEKVVVHHPGRGRVLGPLSLRVYPGQRMVITGPSGAGKSTLIHLLAGMIDHTAGQVWIQGRNLRHFDDNALANAHTWIGQTPLLFRGTLSDNIAMGQAGASEARIREAARLAQVLEFADRLPEGLATRVEERGQNFSGGQVQRVALARALLSRAPVILLDEPTASLDPVGEQQVLRALAGLAETGRTLICATHQPEGMAWADRVIHLSAEGRVVSAESGVRPND